MKVVIVGATGAIGGTILKHVLQRTEVSRVVALTRKPLAATQLSSNEKLENVIIPDFGRLQDVTDANWESILDARAIVWAMGTYKGNEDVDLNYPLAFEEETIKRLSASQSATSHSVRFIVLGGALVVPDQSRTVYFSSAVRKMKGVMQNKTLEFGKLHPDIWEPIVIRPAGVIFNWFTRMAGAVAGTTWAIEGEELGAATAELCVNGSKQPVLENPALVVLGRKMLSGG